ncbi:RDD family protein [Brachybacterium vulturis]|nr:RDD family protein [Brachybacterium vulturis]
MVTQPPMQQNGPGYASGAPSGPGSPVAAPGAPSAGPEMEPPLDGCSPASPLKRFLAALLDAVISTLMVVPVIVGVSVMVASGTAGTLSLVLIGVGVALPLAYVLLMVWLVGAKGFSLGKLILGLRLTRTTAGGPIGFLRSAGRWVLYGLVPPVMALSIFLDPKQHLRGFHDRVVDSTVVDLKTGRDPMKPRPDDFERAGAEHYLGAPSVAVSTHENLLAEPGAAWKDSAQSAPAQPEPAGWGEAQQPEPAGWGEAQQPGAPSPYAPHRSGGSAPSAADAPMTSAPWSSPPAPDPAASQQPAGGGWAPPPIDPIPPSQPSWGQPQSAPEAPLSGDAQGWAPPPPSPQPVQASPAPYGPGNGYPPSDLTGDAWDVEDDGVDEQTRLTVADDPLGDLEQTRISAVQLPAVKQLRLSTDDGGERIVEKAVVIGRNPAAPGEEVLFVMKDDTRSVSKTHLRIDGTGDEVTVTDLGSTNGSSILRADGSRESLVPDSPTVLPTGAQVTLGDRTVTVERMQ